jgi:cytochrome c6
MRKIVIPCIIAVLAVFLYSIHVAAESHSSPDSHMMMASDESGSTGEHLFKNNCAVCHRDGGNVINPEKTLHKEDLDEFGVKTPEDIVNIMRNPGPGMRKFSEMDISNEDAKKIAEYVLKTFK